MPRARLIKPVVINQDFFWDEDLCATPFGARLLYLGLQALATSKGEVPDEPAWLYRMLFPYDRNLITVWLKALVRRGKIQRVGGVITILHWKGNLGWRFARRAWDGWRRILAPQIYERDGRLCAACGATERLSIDHIIPISKGGSNDLENLRVLCLPCNSRKHARLLA